MNACDTSLPPQESGHLRGLSQTAQAPAGTLCHASQPSRVPTGLKAQQAGNTLFGQGNIGCLELLNSIAERIKAQEYLEFGPAQGSPLPGVLVRHRVAVDPSPLHESQASAEADAAAAPELHESESGHFFSHNTRSFDLIFINSPRLYEQAMTDLLCALNALNPGGFVLVRGLIPRQLEQAERSPCAEGWCGDAWKIAFDLWRHHSEIGYFVVDSDDGLGVIWKRDEAVRFRPAWSELVRDLDASVLETMGRDFLNWTAPDPKAVCSQIEAALEEKAGIPRPGNKKRQLRREEQLLRALDDGSGRDCCLLLEQERYQRLDEDRIQSNLTLELFRKNVCRATGGNLLHPEKKVYLLHRALLTPCVPHQGSVPYLWNILDQQGRSMTDLLQRRDGQPPAHEASKAPTQRKGLHVYLGWLTPDFMHFLSELLPQLWLARLMRDRTVRFVVHAAPGEAKAWKKRNDEAAQNIRRVLEHYGISLHELIFVEKPTRFERLIAATPQHRHQRGARSELCELAREVAERHGARSASGPRLVYLSRSRHNGRRFLNGQQLESLFARRGFTIAHPQHMSIQEQMALVANAEIIAGEEGSAFACALFANKPVIIHIETGRFRPELAKLCYLSARRFVYLLPYAGPEAVPQARQNSVLHADPWVVDKALCALFGDTPSGEALCGSRAVSTLLQRALWLSLAGEPEHCMEQLQTLLLRHPAQFQPECVAHCGLNLSQSCASAQRLAVFSALSLKLLRAWRAATQWGQPGRSLVKTARAEGFA